MKKTAYSLNQEVISLPLLFRLFWKKKSLAFVITGFCIIVGLVLAFTNPKEWEVTIKLIPENQSSEGVLSGSLGGLAGLAGINVSGGSDGAINPELYPSIVASTPFMLAVLNQKFDFEFLDQEMTLIGFLNDHRKMSIIDKVGSFPRNLMNGLSSNDPEQDSSNHYNERLTSISWEEQQAIRELGKRIYVNTNKKSGVVSITAKMQDPIVTAELAKFTVEYLKKYLSDYKTSKELRKLNFIEEQLLEKERLFKKAQSNVAGFRDRNLGQLSNAARTELDNLQAEFDLAFNLYSTLQQQREEVKIEVEESTPVFTELEPAVIPNLRSSPKRFLIIAISIFVGLAISGGYVFVRHSSFVI